MTVLVQNVGVTASLPRDPERAGGAPPRARGAASVVLVVREQEFPTASLHRALALSRGLGAGLHVLRVLRRLAVLDAWFERLNLLDATRAVERALNAQRATRAWVDASLADGEVVDRLRVVQGDVAGEVVSYALDLGARLIVVPFRERRMGRAATSLACAAGVPVLIAQEASRESSSTIVAGTDLASPGYPVLRAAADLGRCLDASVVAVHNVHPMSAVVGMGTAWPPVTLLPADPCRAERAERLKRAAQGLPVAAQPVIREEVSPADAILDEARRQGASLVVVGTRRRSWFERLLGGSVAEGVVDHSSCSVLVTPIDAAHP